MDQVEAMRIGGLGVAQKVQLQPERVRIVPQLHPLLLLELRQLERATHLPRPALPRIERGGEGEAAVGRQQHPLLLVGQLESLLRLAQRRLLRPTRESGHLRAVRVEHRDLDKVLHRWLRCGPSPIDHGVHAVEVVERGQPPRRRPPLLLRFVQRATAHCGGDDGPVDAAAELLAQFGEGLEQVGWPRSGGRRHLRHGELIQRALQVDEQRQLVDDRLVQEATRSEQRGLAEGVELVLAPNLGLGHERVDGEPNLRLRLGHRAPIGFGANHPLALHETAERAVGRAVLPWLLLQERHQQHQHVVCVQQPRRDCKRQQHELLSEEAED
mmetsp:Transcript_3247/g.10272  ORF Transcript_3247/g.10272 Transcript_3247/m.10272 type:complete len:327 (-) Transcript_3247:696-1676(-)|eukprot:scaffold1884_cov109-Isochrysis_galbana.AAC.7